LLPTIFASHLLFISSFSPYTPHTIQPHNHTIHCTRSLAFGPSHASLQTATEWLPGYGLQITVLSYTSTILLYCILYLLPSLVLFWYLRRTSNLTPTHAHTRTLALAHAHAHSPTPTKINGPPPSHHIIPRFVLFHRRITSFNTAFRQPIFPIPSHDNQSTQLLYSTRQYNPTQLRQSQHNGIISILSQSFHHSHYPNNHL
jgi:hypothetical protein